jgi:2-hydroxychromene-2-carboxylate isomerase
MADLEFFWDPVCPWAWLTSRWVRNVQAERPLEVDWRFISLRMVNASKDYDTEFPPNYQRGHMRGLELLRVAAAARENGHADQVKDLYIGFGTMIHHARNPTAFDDPEGARAVLRTVGLPVELGEAAYSEEYDPVVKADTDEALERCGGNIGTPVLSWQPPDGPSFFGPVISKAPTGEEALRLWDAVTELGANPWFSELKRSIRSKPQLD